MLQSKYPRFLRQNRSFVPITGVVIIFLLVTSKLSAQIDPNRMTWPSGTTEKQKTAYMKYFGNFQHPDAYYRLPVDKQRAFDINMHKYKSLRTNGWIIVGVGAVFAGIGAAIPKKSDTYTDVIFYGIGGAMMVSSIPLFVNSAKRAKAAQLIIANAPRSTSFFKISPQLGIRLQL